jgi:hypothetical protein
MVPIDPVLTREEWYAKQEDENLNAARIALLGRKVTRIDYMSREEMFRQDWYNRPMILVFDDGTEVFCKHDDNKEGGALVIDGRVFHSM